MNNAQTLFNRFDREGYALITEMVSTNQEENLFIDFKEKSDPNSSSMSADDRRNYAKAVSGFSNSEGGLIVWGVYAKHIHKDSADVAQEERPIRNLKKFLTDLNSLLSSACVPLNSGIINMAICCPGQDDMGFVITYIPECDLIPVRALLTVNQYYTRCGDSFVMMEHHLLADAFGRRQRPKLEICYRIETSGNRGQEERGIRLIVGMMNTGRYIATFPAIRVKMDETKLEWGRPRETINFNLIRQTNDMVNRRGYLFTGGINHVLHPGTSIEVASFEPSAGFLYMPAVVREGINCEFEYELFAEGCEPVDSKIHISTEDICAAVDFTIKKPEDLPLY